MKKIISILIAVLIILSFSTVLFAKEKTDTDYQKYVTDIVDSNPDQYSGWYWSYLTNSICIVPYAYATDKDVLTEENIPKDVKEHIKVAFDQPAKYSEKELSDAEDRILSHYKELHISETGSDIKNNCIRLSSRKWTDSEKKAVLEIAGIDNIKFEIITEANQSYENIDRETIYTDEELDKAISLINSHPATFRVTSCRKASQNKGLRVTADTQTDEKLMTIRIATGIGNVYYEGPSYRKLINPH